MDVPLIYNEQHGMLLLLPIEYRLNRRVRELFVVTRERTEARGSLCNLISQEHARRYIRRERKRDKAILLCCIHIIITELVERDEIALILTGSRR